MKAVQVLASGIILFAIVATLGVLATFDVASAQVAPTCTINATTVSTGPGTPVSLTWSSSNATSAFLTPVGNVSTSGNQTVHPNATTIYTLTVYNSTGQQANCQTTVVVSGSSSGAPFCSIHANPTNVNQNNPTTLTWNSTNATSANLTSHGSVATNSSRTVYPSGTTTYTLTVYNSQNQSAQCQTTVFVGGSQFGTPSCWITLTNYSVGSPFNQAATLQWGSNNATSANISPNVGSVSTSGSRTVYTQGYQNYTMTVYNSQNQSATCQTSQQQYYPPNNYNYPPPPVNPPSSISLTQIPYTGFDLGALGNTLYWFVLALFALAAGYLMIYYLPAALRTAQAGLPTRGFGFSLSASTRRQPEARAVSEEVSLPARLRASRGQVVRAEGKRVAPLKDLPLFRSDASKDSMSFSTEGEMPRIIVTRN